MAGLQDFANSYFGTLGLAQQYQLNKQQQEMNAINLQKTKNQMAAQQQIQGALQKMWEQNDVPTGKDTRPDSQQWLDRAKMLEKEADIYRTMGGIEFEKQAKDSSMEANRLRMRAASEQKQNAQAFSDAFTGINDQASLDGAIDKLYSENPDLFNRLQDDAIKHGIKLQQFTPETKAYLNARLSSSKDRVAVGSMEERIRNNTINQDLKAEKQRADREAKMQSLQLQSLRLQNANSDLDLKERKFQLQKQEEQRKKEADTKKYFDSYAKNVQAYQKNVQAAINQRMTNERKIQGLMLPKEEEVKQLNILRSDYNKQLNTIIGNARAAGVKFATKPPTPSASPKQDVIKLD